MPLFAEMPDWVPWLAATGGGAVVWLATWFANRDRQKRADKKDDEKGIVEHQDETIKNLSRELGDVRARCDRQDALIGRMLIHIGRLEGVMTARGDKFEPFDMDGTSEHKALPVAVGGK